MGSKSFRLYVTERAGIARIFRLKMKLFVSTHGRVLPRWVLASGFRLAMLSNAPSSEMGAYSCVKIEGKRAMVTNGNE